MEKIYCKDCGRYLYSLEEVDEEGYYCEECSPPNRGPIKSCRFIKKPKAEERPYKFNFQMPH